MALSYHHRQIGWVMLAVAATTAIAISLPLVVLTQMSLTRILLPLLPFAAVMGIVMMLFSSMTVQVDGDVLAWHFGLRFWRKTLLISDIEAATAIRSKWYWGYGIKYFGPNRWLYNVSGRDAVELKLKNGGWIRLGTDDAAGLLLALRAQRMRDA